VKSIDCVLFNFGYKKPQTSHIFSITLFTDVILKMLLTEENPQPRPPVSRKRKIEEEGRGFHEKWEVQYFFTQIKEKCNKRIQHQATLCYAQ
jgi:hypothetical protein